MKIPITEHHRSKAVAAISNPGAMVTKCCIVWQALRDAGVDVISVLEDRIRLADREIRLDRVARDIIWTDAAEWATMTLPKSFEFDLDKLVAA